MSEQNNSDSEKKLQINSEVLNATRGFKGVWIPEEIYVCSTLSWFEKILWTEIDYLAKGPSGCFASNEYFAELLGVSQQTVSNNIAHLKKLKLIEEIGFDGRHRYLKTKDEPFKELVSLLKIYRQDKKDLYAGNKRFIANNINNNINNNKPLSKDNGGPDGPASAPIQRKRHAPILPPPKPPPKKRVFIQPGSDAEKVVAYWNKLKHSNPQCKLAEHKDMTTKKMQSVALHVGELIKGTFGTDNGKKWKAGFFEKNKIPNKTPPIKLREITRLMTKYLDFFKEGYWPHNKKHLPRDLPGFLLSGYPEKTSYLLRTKFNPADEQSSEPKDYRPQYTDVFRRYGMLDGLGTNGQMKDIYSGIAAIERRVLRDGLFNWNDIRIKARFGKPEEGGMVGLFEEYCEFINREWNEWAPEDVWNQWGRCFKDWVRTVQQEMEM